MKKELKNLFLGTISSVIFIGCTSTSTLGLKQLSDKNVAVYNNINDAYMEDILEITIDKNDIRYQNMRKEFISESPIIKSKALAGRCQQIHNTIRKLPSIAFKSHREGNQIEVLKRYHQCIGGGTFAVDKKDLFSIKNYAWTGTFKKTYKFATLAYSVDESGFVYHKNMLTLPISLLDGKIWNNYGFITFGFTETGKFPTLFSGHKYRAPVYNEKGINIASRQIGAISSSLLSNVVTLLQKYKVPFKVTEGSMGISNGLVYNKDGKLRLVTMFLGMAPKGYSKEDVFTTFNPK